ncbi:MAG: iron-containing alcohol dehydrogenase [Acidobacteria bacterium]|nr:iron-containing alcohol dehydrogenase [Acidobacteriota bacterium]
MVAARSAERERLAPFDVQLRTRVVFGAGSFNRLGALAAELGFRRPLLVADHGLLDVGHVRLAERQLEAVNISVVPFHDFDVNPDTEMIAGGCKAARPHAVDAIIGLGGGSSMDCAKGINFVLTNGGRMEDYRGYGKATRPLLPMIGIPTTAGTGSEAQSYAVISDATTHVKMACGDAKAAFSVAILDPELTLSQPASVTATSGFDALAHAVETAVTTRRTSLSDCFARESWRLLNAHYETVLDHPDDLDARAAMQLGAFHAGLAIEQSMLGAAHACANPLTARYQISHGVALAIVLPHVVRWNGPEAGPLYSRLLGDRPDGDHLGNDDRDDAADRLAARLRHLANRAGLPSKLGAQGVTERDLPQLADDAALQWTGTFNPRPFAAADALEIYRCAF